MNTFELTIEGMHCDRCADRIAMLLNKQNGIHEVSISWQAGTGRIIHNPQSTSQERIVSIIQSAGFTLGNA